MDFFGDSFEFVRKVVNIDVDVIVFVGVDFMVEIVKIFNFEKMVFLFILRVICVMVNMFIIKYIIEVKKKYLDVFVVFYVNSLVEVKVYVDVIVIFVNVVKIVGKFDFDVVIFGLDKNFVYYVVKVIGKKVIFVFFNGYCYVYRKFMLEDVECVRKFYLNVKFMVYFECELEV